MKFIGSNGGRCLKLFAWEEVRPEHGITNTMLVAAAVERFNFQFRPPSPIPPDVAIKLADGSAVIDGVLIAIQKLDLYSDGFAVECANTADAKLVSDELIRWAQADLGFRDFIRPPRVLFQSQVTVEFSPEFENLFKSWKKLQAILNGSVQARYGFDRNIDVYRLQWRGDAHTIVNNVLVSDFWMERKLSEPHATNRWVCVGPLPMDEWVALLEGIENFAISN